MKIGVALPTSNQPSGPPPPYAVTRSFALRAESLGFDSIWIFDHLLYRYPDKPDTGVHEPWTMLSALAEATSRVELGTLVLAMRFRNPALLAKMTAALDDVSQGRLILGIGAGWHDPEHEAFGYPLDHRLGRFDEALEILVSLLRTNRATFEGEWHQARDAVLIPPMRTDVPLLIAGRSPRMLRAVARHADQFNTAWFGRPDDPLLLERMGALEEACRAIGRDPATIVKTLGVNVRYPGGEPTADPIKSLRGSPRQIADGLRAFEEAGYDHLIVWLEPMTEASVERLGEALPLLRA
jgi:probable F420-dependent oxidoreductase